MQSYQDFLRRKSQVGGESGFAPVWMPDFLKDFQRHIVDWAVRRGRAGVFASTGLGKTVMQLTFAENVRRKTGGSVLILTPLAVSRQTGREAAKFGIRTSFSQDGKHDGRRSVVNRPAHAIAAGASIHREGAMLIATCSRDAARRILHPRPYLVVSITDPPPFGDDRRVEFWDDDQRLDVLHLQFADFHEKHFRYEHEGRPLKEWAMTPSHGSILAEFLRLYDGRFETLIVHCEAGVSRSPSIALAVAEHYGVPRVQIEPVSRNWDAQPINPWCYKLAKEALARGSTKQPDRPSPLEGP